MRWNSPYINHFILPDSIIPDQTNPQDWDRYAYVRNNPLRYTDPSGHVATQGCGDDGKAACIETNPVSIAKNAQHIAELKQGGYDRKCAAGKSVYCSGWSNGYARPMIGIHMGAGSTMDFIYGGYAYDQTDYIFDFKSGTLFVTKTTGDGTYVGTPNGASIEGYVGITNIYGIPSAATPDQVSGLLAGPNLDGALDVGVEIIPDLDISVGKGISVDLNPATSGPMITTAGPMYSTEKKIGIGASIIPTGIDLGAQGGHSETIVPVYYQLPFWPFR